MHLAAKNEQKPSLYSSCPRKIPNMENEIERFKWKNKRYSQSWETEATEKVSRLGISYSLARIK